MREDAPGDETLMGHMLGTTGNLREPTIRTGDTLIVGFNEEVFTKTLA